MAEKLYLPTVANDTQEWILQNCFSLIEKKLGHGRAVRFLLLLYAEFLNYRTVENDVMEEVRFVFEMTLIPARISNQLPL